MLDSASEGARAPHIKMTKILHILKEPQTPIALEMISQEAKKPDQAIMILLIQEAVQKTLPVNDSLKTYILKEDLEERGLPPPTHSQYTCINYQGMLALIYEADKVVTW
jgi:sulfur relay protein TusB/DsrH